MARLFQYIVIALVALIPPSFAHGPEIEVTAAWARATSANATTGGAYLTIKNGGHEGDRLLSAASPAAAKTELHTMTEDGGVMKMRALTDLPIAAGATVEFKPGAKHVMLIGLVKPLAEGDKFPLILTFEHAGKVQVTVTVGKPGAGAATGDGAMAPDMKM